MSGAMRKVGVYLGLLEDSDRYDDDYESYDDYETPTQRAVQPSRDDRGTVSQLADHRPRPVSVPVTAELSRITTLHPRTYNEARTIGENFREGVPVIMNLSEMEDVDAKRLVDFAAGLIFGLRGTI